MNTPACLRLPPPPDIVRAQCPPGEAENYLSSYLWKCGCALPRVLFPIFHDLRYGYCLFPDRTLDYGELKHDGINLYMNISGTNYTSGITDEVFDAQFDDPCIVRKYGYDCDPGGTASDAWDMYDATPTSDTLGATRNCNFSCTYLVLTTDCGAGVLGYRAKAHKLYFKFDTSGASANPQTATVTFTCDARNNTGLSNPTLRLYSQDYGASVDTGDWSGGTLVDTYLLDVGNVWPMESVDVSFSVDTQYVNIGGNSKFKLNYKEVDDGTHPDTATGFVCQSIKSLRLTLTF